MSEFRVKFWGRKIIFANCGVYGRDKGEGVRSHAARGRAKIEGFCKHAIYWRDKGAIFRAKCIYKKGGYISM